MQGNEACVEGALAAGLRFFAGYPITPSTEIAELLAERLPQVGGAFIQMEDELASMGAVVGASLAGLKAMTATSGPGFSLKQENIGFAALAEVPCVIVDVQRVGPSTGMPTSPAQGDVMQARWGTHGDHPTVAFTPWSVSETFSLTVTCFNVAEELRTPVILLLDEVIGHMREKVVLPPPEAVTVVDRKKPAVPPGEGYSAYDPGDGDIPPLAAFGDGYRFHVTGLLHDRSGFPTNDPEEAAYLLNRICEKVERRRARLTMIESRDVHGADVVVVAYGCTARPASRAVRMAREAGIRAGLVRLITLWPFPREDVARLTAGARRILVPEMNLGQIVHEVESAVAGRIPVVHLGKVGGVLMTPEEIFEAVKGV
ncbi:MAG: 2-oxoacid:acceptor oxidoreductase subunit alpha [Firmicutes bacterium]|jgi:2-oxoglutarate ferredoxin oxidoreductase subunit alpha|nr:2-oxoacid:acceptor oxidoreductase subunit alpha [Bacillota bacterium]